MSSFAGVVGSSAPRSPFPLLPPFSSAARTSSSSSSFSLRAPKSSSPFFNSGIGVSLRSKSTTPKISIWVASKRVPLQTQESNWEYPYDGSDSDHDDDDEDEEGNKEEREQEFENDFGKDEEEKRIEAGVAAARYVNTATAPTQYEEELIKEVELLLDPEEKAILEQNEYPVLSKISTTKWSPFHSLALSVQIPFMDKLLQSGFDIDAVDKDGATPLHYAVQVGAIQTVKLLIKYKVDVNVADNEGWTPLHVAVQSRSRDIAKVLLVNGADRTRRNKDGKAPLDLALCFGKDFKSYEVSKLLKLVPANRDL
ncbi:hypothetical protein AAC387_Pa03g3082 [Persea americana]